MNQQAMALVSAVQTAGGNVHHGDDHGGAACSGDGEATLIKAAPQDGRLPFKSVYNTSYAPASKTTRALASGRRRRGGAIPAFDISRGKKKRYQT